MNNKGLTLIELLITLFLLAVILSAVYLTYITLLKDYRKESVSIEHEVERVIGLDIIRLDLTHAGFGISDNETSKVIECINCDDSDPSDNELIIRSTFNVTNTKTQNWIFVNADDNTTVGTIDTTMNYVYIDTDKKLLKDNSTWTNRPGSGKYIAYPVESDDDGCTDQACTEIKYKMVSSNLPATCNPNTFKFDRAINGAAGNPIIDCVADFTVRFDYDSNGDGEIITTEELKKFSDISGANATDFKKKLKRTHVYILLQDGKYDRNFTFNGNISNGKLIIVDNDGDGICDSDDVCLKLPNDYQHYRWKVIQFSVKPMDL